MARLLAPILIALVATASPAAETLVMFTAAWCPACRTAKADLKADQGLAGGRELLEVDVDRQPGVASRRGVRTLPTFIIEADGREVRRLVGYPGPDGLRQFANR